MFNKKERRLLALVCAVLMALCGLVWLADKKEPTADPAPVPVVSENSTPTATPVPTPEVQTTPEPPPEKVRIMQGEFTVTAYCSCEKCCEYWATVRPLDKDGQPIVYTASGTIAKQGRTIAVDPEVFPYGTEVWFDGPWGEQCFVAEDCGGAVKGKHIDIYFDDHESACRWAVQTKPVWLYVEEETNDQRDI